MRKSSNRKVSNMLFPARLHKLLCEVRSDGQDDIIAWLPDGKSFKVHDKLRFEKEIMPSYFGSSKFRSFQKNLNMWDFKLVRKTGSYNGACSHPLFVRDSPYMCHGMVRQSALYKSLGGNPKGRRDDVGSRETILPKKTPVAQGRDHLNMVDDASCRQKCLSAEIVPEKRRVHVSTGAQEERYRRCVEAVVELEATKLVVQEIRINGVETNANPALSAIPLFGEASYRSDDLTGTLRSPHNGIDLLPILIPELLASQVVKDTQNYVQLMKLARSGTRSRFDQPISRQGALENEALAAFLLRRET